MKTRIAAPLLIAALAYAPVALAAPKAAENRFQSYDANKDGALTRDELTAGLKAKAEGAGKTFKPKAVDRIFTAGDADKDGRLTKAEFQSANAGAKKKKAAAGTD